MPVNPMNLSQASQSSDITGALQQLLLSRVPSPEQEQWQRQARQDTMEEYQNQLRQPAMGDYSPMQHSLNSMLKQFSPHISDGFAALHGIGEGGDMMMKQNMLRQAGETAAAKVAFDNAKEEDKLSLGELGVISRMASGRGGAGSFIQFKDDAGNLYIMNKATGQREMVPATHAKLWGDAYAMAYKRATDETMENPEDYATNFANATMRKVPGGVTTIDTVQKPTRPMGELGPINPGVTPIPTDAAGAPIVAPDDSKAGANGFPSGRGKEEDRQAILKQEWVAQDDIIKRYNSDLTHPEVQRALRNQAELKKEMKTLDTSKLTPAVQPEAPADAGSIKYKDKRVEEQNKGYGSEEGKGLYKERDNLSQLYGANAKIIGQVDLLDRIYNDPNIPEGELGPYIQQVRSGLKSLGIDVAPNAGAADVARAISTNMSLQMKNADGHNLLPGAMSNYEDQLLQKMAPTLSMTAEGRKALIQVMRQVAESNQRLAQEATVMAKENKGQLPASWYARKERVMLEEMVRLKKLHDALDKQWGFSTGGKK